MATEASQPTLISAPIAALARIDDEPALAAAVKTAPGRPRSVPDIAGTNGAAVTAPTAREPVHSPAAGVSLKDLADGLRNALLARETIGVAQGMLMQRCGLTKNQSYEVLQRYAQEHGVTVCVLAQRFLRSGRITINVDDLVAAVTEPPAGRGSGTF